MSGCSECRKPCPEHNITWCRSCHNHPSECGVGGCLRSDVGGTTFEFSEKGRVFERRRFCLHHSTHPHFGWLRRGGVPVTS